MKALTPKIMIYIAVLIGVVWLLYNYPVETLIAIAVFVLGTWAWYMIKEGG